MEYRNDNNKLTIFLSGRISNDNSAKTEQEVMEICDSNSFDRLVLDAEKLIYISSAGLRVIMKLMRKYSNISVIGTSAEVYDVFSVTGFTEIINVEKAYRTMSVDGCDIIGTGAYGTVYRVSEDTIVKVFSDNFRTLTARMHSLLAGLRELYGAQTLRNITGRPKKTMAESPAQMLFRLE